MLAFDPVRLHARDAEQHAAHPDGELCVTHDPVRARHMQTAREPEDVAEPPDGPAYIRVDQAGKIVSFGAGRFTIMASP